MESKENLKAQVASFMKRAYDTKLTTSTGGNISTRCGSVMLITPSSLDKSSLTADVIAEVDIETGENLTPGLRLSIETEMHRMIYLERPEVNAVVHSHPTFACMFTAAKEEIETRMIAESWYLLECPVKVPYARMGTKGLAENVARCAGEGASVMLLENHGALTVGRDLLNAFDRMECLEQSAKMTIFSRAAGLTTELLTPERMRGIDDMKKK